ncbi:MAG: DAK2 domain-containing protein [Gaiellales bacterium]
MDGARARELARSALAWLEASRQRINDLNVYPVPDGDTGTNLTLTVRAIVDALERSDATGPEAVAKELSDAALRGACGNSGVIFSQIVRGFADVLGKHAIVDGPVLSLAFRSASDSAYRAVRRPVEGTMLTVIREMAEEAEEPDVRNLSTLDLLRRVVARGELAVARTPELLAVLREAGVVDAGGAGLLEIVRGLAAGVAGEAPPDQPVESHELGIDAIHQELSEYRYCTVFLVEGEELDADALESQLEPLGDSLLVVGTSELLKIHVHTDDPGVALSYGVKLGTIAGVEIANMHAQTVEREERLAAVSEALAEIPTLETALVVVAPGRGTRMLFEEAGATRVVEGGQTMNPSTGEIAAAVEAAPSPHVIVLPNNRNVILSAEQAIGLSDGKNVRVIPTRTVQEGIRAAHEYEAEADPETNVERMTAAIGELRTGEITKASRTVTLDGVDVREGEFLGLADGRAIVSTSSFDDAVDAVVETLLGEGQSILGVLVGEGGPDGDELRSRLEVGRPLVDIEVLDGGQPHYPLLLWSEP